MTDGLTEDTDRGEFVTEAELQVLRALWRLHSRQMSLTFFANQIGVRLSLVERVEALLFPSGMD